MKNNNSRKQQVPLAPALLPAAARAGQEMNGELTCSKPAALSSGHDTEERHRLKQTNSVDRGGSCHSPASGKEREARAAIALLLGEREIPFQGRFSKRKIGKIPQISPELPGDRNHG